MQITDRKLIEHKRTDGKAVFYSINFPMELARALTEKFGPVKFRVELVEDGILLVPYSASAPPIKALPAWLR